MLRKSAAVMLTVALLAGGSVSVASAAQDRNDRVGAAETVRLLAQDVTASHDAVEGKTTKVADGTQDYLDAVVADAKQARNEAVKAAQGRLESSRGKVLDDKSRQALKRQIDEAREARSLPRLDQAVVDLERARVRVGRDVEEWKAERRRRAEEAARRAAAAAQGAGVTARSSVSSGSSSAAGTSSGRTSTGGGSSARQQSSPPAAASGGRTDTVRAILARHGCGSAGVRWDDPRLRTNGAADWYNNTVLLRSSMPSSRLPYVVAHECVHLIQYRVYGGDIDALMRDMNAIYGGSGFSGLEQNADCVTKRWGYSTYNYTRSCGGKRGEAAAAIAAGRKP